DQGELRVGIKPHLTETTKRLHQDFAPGILDPDVWNSSTGTDRPGSSHDLDLPRNTLYVLVSSFLASHNPRETDCDAFTAQSTRVRERKKTGKTTEAGVDDLLEAKAFPLERLLSILTSLVSSTNADTRAANATGNTELFAQIKSLVKLDLLCTIGRGIDLSNMRFRCNISREL
ncbi:unnamed protein product, partial [Discosporangium mesarthrocarpum]